MWISLESSSAPKMEAEKSLPLRPRVVCTPRRSEAMKPVMIRVPVNPVKLTAPMAVPIATVSEPAVMLKSGAAASTAAMVIVLVWPT